MRVGLLLLLVACGDDASAPSDAMTDAPIDMPGPPPHLVVYTGGQNITWHEFDMTTGALTRIDSIAPSSPTPSFLAITGTHLYATGENGGRVGAYAIDQQTGALTFINDVPSTGQGPAHVSIDASGQFVFVANYTAGSVAVLPVRADGGLVPATQTLAAGAQAHQILTDPTNRFVLVPCKGADWVAQYTFASGTLTANTTPRVMTENNAGPRHVAFSASGTHAYLINELGSTLTAFSFDTTTGRLTELQTVSSRAAGASGTNTGAEVVVHDDVVYVSNRGDNTIGAFRIAADGRVSLIGHTPTGGMTPRNFAIDPTGHWMLVGNQDSNRVASFSIDDGVLSPVGTPTMAQSVSFVGFAALP